jgi:hypothetical protein
MTRLDNSTLRRLRNDIPIDFVILSILRIPAKSSEGFLRFLCPICSEFNSATNPRTNLARCFRCGKNFNPIDLVIADSRIPFREAVNALIPFLEKTHDPRPP